MRGSLNSKLERLRADYARVAGRSFVHFFCPVLFKDEEAEPCKAHIVPKAFPRSSRAWTVQRKDVDGFYGTNFEDDFAAIRYRIEGQTPSQVLTDTTLSRRFRPTIRVHGEPVGYFVAREAVPEHFTPVTLQGEGKSIRLGLKIPPGSASAEAVEKLDIEIAKDVRIPALVSLIKAAHLTLFDMLGYRYALSAGGHFVGGQILGAFFCRNHAKSKSEVAEEAVVFFREFAHMARAVNSHPGFGGTITDRSVLVCRASRGLVWALIVFVRTSELLHAVVIPVLDQPDAAAMYYSFLHNDNDSIEVSSCHLGQDSWEIHPEVGTLVWPKTGGLYQ